MPDVYRKSIPWTSYRYGDHRRPLGRNIEHDERSRQYAHLASGRTLVAVNHKRFIGILDQGDVGSCTGNACTGALGTSPVEDALTPPTPAMLNEAFALKLYSAAETIDGDGPYPPHDNGSSGLSVAKAALNAGYVSGYRHAFSLTDALDALQDGPVLWGTNWLAGMDAVNTTTGLIKFTGASRGGHELVLRSFDPATGLVGGDNSWGASWGLRGSFVISATDLGKSLADDGDVTILVPLSQPAPVPTPVPVVDPDLAAWWAATAVWAHARHVTTNAAAARAALAYAASQGLDVTSHIEGHHDHGHRD